MHSKFFLAFSDGINCVVYSEGMKIKGNATELSGYRLPTEAEWELACRGGSSCTYGFGESVPLLERYAQYVLNASGRSQSVETLLPNSLGLFDMHGNLWECTQNPSTASLSPVRNNVVLALRGGSFINQSTDVIYAARYTNLPSDRSNGPDEFGFRLARTLPLIPLTSLPPAAEGDRN